MHHSSKASGDQWRSGICLSNFQLPGHQPGIVYQGRTDNSWGPWAIGDHGAPVSLPKFKKAYEKGTRGISWGPLLTPGSRAVPKFPNGQSTPA
ncbi:unnamed protein product, partial [Staurois parvus]